jgi:hypothetical protein
MSKPIVRVVFAVLISLVIITAVSTNVQASLGSMLRMGDANSDVSATDQALGRATLSARGYTYFQFYEDYAPDSSHDCHSDPYYDD